MPVDGNEFFTFFIIAFSRKQLPPSPPLKLKLYVTVLLSGFCANILIVGFRNVHEIVVS